MTTQIAFEITTDLDVLATLAERNVALADITSMVAVRLYKAFALGLLPADMPPVRSFGPSNRKALLITLR